MTVGIEPLTAALWDAGGRAAYQAGIDGGHATFAERAPDWAGFAAGKIPGVLLAAVEDGRCVGFAAVGPSFARAVYSGVAEVSVYVDPAAAGRGVGAALLDELVRVSEGAGIWTLESLIFPENAASLRLHRRAGFRDVGVRERFGFMTHGPLAGAWRDVLLLERRSARVGA